MLALARADDDIEVVTPGDGSTGDGGVDVVVHLGSGDHDRLARRRQNITEGVDRTLAEAIDRDAGHLVLVSSAMVYGAWPNNPVPLTEDAILRPDVEFVLRPPARRRRGDGRPLAPPAPGPHGRRAATGGDDGRRRRRRSSPRSLAAGLGQRFGEDDPPAQFLHLDDLAAAVVLAVGSRLDGVFNVAPDGWIAGERVRALVGRARHGSSCPSARPRWSAALRWRFQRGPIPPGLRSYTRAPVGGRQRPAQGRRLGADGDQRAGLRRGHRGASGGRWSRRSDARSWRSAAMVAGVVVALVAAALGIRRWRRR